MSAFGPADLPSGHPTYYEDSTGLQLALCIDDPGCPASPKELVPTPPNDEAFYQLANAEMLDDEGHDVTVDFNVEGAFLGTATGVKPITFGRIQFTAKKMTPGATYTVEHPYGTSHFTVDDRGELLGSDRAGQREETDGTFGDTLNSTIGPFLRSTSAPEGYIGDGLTATTVTGGPQRNFVRVSGPGLPELVLDPVTNEVSGGLTTDLFTVEGKIFDPTAPLPPAPVPA
jgi:hypothetical protein